MSPGGCLSAGDDGPRITAALHDGGYRLPAIMITGNSDVPMAVAGHESRRVGFHREARSAAMSYSPAWNVLWSSRGTRPSCLPGEGRRPSGPVSSLLDHKLQNRHSKMYRRSKYSKMTDMFTTDGRRGGKIIAEMEGKGYTFAFDPSDSKRIVGICPGGGSCIPNLENGALADHIEDYLDKFHPWKSSKWKTKRMEAFYSRYKVSRRPVVIRADGDPEDPEKAVNKNLADDVMGENVETDVKGRPVDEDASDKEKAQKKKTTRPNGATLKSRTDRSIKL